MGDTQSHDHADAHNPASCNLGPPAESERAQSALPRKSLRQTETISMTLHQKAVAALNALRRNDAVQQDATNASISYPVWDRLQHLFPQGASLQSDVNKALGLI